MDMFLLTGSLIIGLIIGSFLNVVIVRYPKMLQRDWEKECRAFLNLPQTDSSHQIAHSDISLALPRSHCPHCQHPLKLRHNIPLLSFIFLGGRCQYCRQRISRRYPIIEASMALLTLAAVWRFGWQPDFSAQAIFAVLFIALIITLCGIDLEHQLLPDIMTLGGLWLGLCMNSFNVFTPLFEALWSAVLGYGFLWLTSWIFLKIRQKQGMGHGDFKMLAMTGAWLGSLNTLNTLLFAVLFGCLISLILLALRKAEWQRPIPFGPFLGAGALASLFLGPFMLNWLWAPLS